MAKVPPKLYRISEVAQYSGLSRQTISYYTYLGLITPATRTPSRHRLYDASVFERLEKIRELKREGRTLLEIREILRRGGEVRTEGEQTGSESGT